LINQPQITFINLKLILRWATKGCMRCRLGITGLEGALSYFWP